MAKQGLQGTGGATAFICSPVCAASWRRAPSSSPRHQPGDPPWIQFGLRTSVFPGSQGFVVETLPEGPSFGSSSPNTCGKAAKCPPGPRAEGKIEASRERCPSGLQLLPEMWHSINPWHSGAGDVSSPSLHNLPSQNVPPEKGWIQGAHRHQGDRHLGGHFAALSTFAPLHQQGRCHLGLPVTSWEISRGARKNNYPFIFLGKYSKTRTGDMKLPAGNQVLAK